MGNLPIRIARLKREAAACVIMRKKGISINQIASFFGRSRSFVFRILKANGLTYRVDLRKLPRRIKSLSARRMLQTLEKLRTAWENWVLGEEGKPP
jgi:transposase